VKWASLIDWLPGLGAAGEQSRTSFVDVACGYEHTVLVSTEGRVVTFGAVEVHVALEGNFVHTSFSPPSPDPLHPAGMGDSQRGALGRQARGKNLIESNGGESALPGIVYGCIREEVRQWRPATHPPTQPPTPKKTTTHQHKRARPPCCLLPALFSRRPTENTLLASG
jgi:hypothetical protein